ncbi:MAG: hypothetical protein KIT09_33150 [Bryobacteraceae bacterium]|nr:hypothetical protein [Bryobacteraceae bacterium]
MFPFKMRGERSGERREWMAGLPALLLLPFFGAGPAAGQVTLTDNVDWEGQSSCKIVTPTATYYFHKQGAGFASMIDIDGRDWIGYRPFGGPDGQFRGIPNLVHPEGHFHPGGMACSSRIASADAAKVTIVSECQDNQWAARWDVFPQNAHLTVLRAPRTYWFLYEGSLAGKFEPEQQYVVRSSGQRTSAAESWEGDLPGPEWVYFGDNRISRVLYLVHHDDDDAIDSYWPMQGQMTVFGFGRLRLNTFMEATPNRFTIGFAESEAAARSAIEEALGDHAAGSR